MSRSGGDGGGVSRPEGEGGGGGVSSSGGDARVTASERRDVGGAEASMLSMLIPLESAGTKNKNKKQNYLLYKYKSTNAGEASMLSMLIPLESAGTKKKNYLLY